MQVAATVRKLIGLFALDPLPSRPDGSAIQPSPVRLELGQSGEGIPSQTGLQGNCYYVGEPVSVLRYDVFLTTF